MDDIVLRRESAVEYFRELVEGAISRQGIVAGELTAFYVVQMLAGFIRQPDAEHLEQPLAARLLRALEYGAAERRTSLRQIGDASLFLSGFFPDSLRRRLVDVDYYAQIGGVAYNTLSRQETDT